MNSNCFLTRVSPACYNLRNMETAFIATLLTAFVMTMGMGMTTMTMRTYFQRAASVEHI